MNRLKLTKFHLLIITTFILAVVSYQLAFKKTIVAWNLNHKLNAEINDRSELNEQPDYIKRKSDNLGHILSQYKTDSVAFRSGNINNIAAIAEKYSIKLSSVPVQDPQNQTDQYMCQKIEFEGSYFGLLNTLYGLEQEKQIGYIKSVDMLLVNENVNNLRVKKLKMSIYVAAIR